MTQQGISTYISGGGEGGKGFKKERKSPKSCRGKERPTCIYEREKGGREQAKEEEMVGDRPFKTKRATKHLKKNNVDPHGREWGGSGQREKKKERAS